MKLEGTGHSGRGLVVPRHTVSVLPFFPGVPLSLLCVRVWLLTRSLKDAEIARVMARQQMQADLEGVPWRP